MLSAKSISVKPVDKRVAKRYLAGKFSDTAKVNLGVFLNRRLEGMIQIGRPSPRKATIVTGTPPDAFLEIKTISLSDYLPRNAGSRVMSVVMRIIRNTFPSVKWAIADVYFPGQGDGAMLRGSGFRLINIMKRGQGASRYRYIFFLDRRWRVQLAVPSLPFTSIPGFAVGRASPTPRLSPPAPVSIRAAIIGKVMMLIRSIRSA